MRGTKIVKHRTAWKAWKGKPVKTAAPLEGMKRRTLGPQNPPFEYRKTLQLGRLTILVHIKKWANLRGVALATTKGEGGTGTRTLEEPTEKLIVLRLT